MSTVVDIASFRHNVFQSNFATVSNLSVNSSGVYKFTSTHNASCYINYDHPIKLPNGTAVTFKCKMRYVSGGIPRITLAYFTDPAFSQNKTFNFWSEADITHTDWQDIEFTEYLPIGSGYVQCELGYFQGSTSGVVEFKDPQLVINRGVTYASPQCAESLTQSVYLNDLASSGRWHRYTSGSGTITDGTDHVIITAPAASDQARLVLDGVSSVSSINVDEPSYVVVKLDAKRVSGVPVVYLDCFGDAGGSSVAALNRAIISSDFSDNILIFSIPDGVKSIRPSIGFASANIGVVHVKSAQISVYGGRAHTPSSVRFGTLLKTSGVWSLANTFNGYASAGFSSVTASTPAKNITVGVVNGVMRPTVICDIRGVDETYDVRVQSVVQTTSVGNGSIVIQIFKSGISIDPDSLPDGTFISIAALNTTV